MFSLGGSLVITPYVIYNFMTIKKSPDIKTNRIVYSLILQFCFTVQTVRWSKQYRKYDVEMQKKYLDGLSEYYITNFASEYLPWLLSQRSNAAIYQNSTSMPQLMNQPPLFYN